MSTATVQAAHEDAAGGHALVGFFARFVGLAALTAAGMIGAGAVATRLLAGAWFGFELLWVALYVIPMVIFTLDSASRVAMMSTGRGMLEMVRSEIGAWLALTIFLAAFAVNLIVNMSQMAAMVEGSYGAFGMLPPASPGAGFILIIVALTAFSVTLAVLGGYKRVERVLTLLLVRPPAGSTAGSSGCAHVESSATTA